MILRAHVYMLSGAYEPHKLLLAAIHWHKINENLQKRVYFSILPQYTMQVELSSPLHASDMNHMNNVAALKTCKTIGFCGIMVEHF